MHEPILERQEAVPSFQGSRNANPFGASEKQAEYSHFRGLTILPAGRLLLPEPWKPGMASSSSRMDSCVSGNNNLPVGRINNNPEM
jgi:hypothetical protein